MAGKSTDMEAIILAGGLGTRLRSVVSDLPKPMARVANRPFLDYILHDLATQGVGRVVLAVGYKWEAIRDHYENPENNFGLEISYSIESEPLGTGGAIFKAAGNIQSNRFLVVNGDTSFPVSLIELERFADHNEAEIVLALREVDNADRYGLVHCSPDSRILAFSEKGVANQPGTKNLINGGIYLMCRELIDKFSLPGKFSFEVDFLQENLGRLNAYGIAFDAPFIDIGIPDDYNRAQKLFENVIP